MLAIHLQSELPRLPFNYLWSEASTPRARTRGGQVAESPNFENIGGGDFDNLSEKFMNM